MKISRLRPIYSKVSTRWGVWLWRDYSGRCDVQCNGKSIYDDIYSLITWLGYGIAFGYAGSLGSRYVDTRGEPARRWWFGKMRVYS